MVGDFVDESKGISLPPNIRKVIKILSTLLRFPDEFTILNLQKHCYCDKISTTSGLLCGSFLIEETTHKNQNTSKCSLLKFIAIFFSM